MKSSPSLASNKTESAAKVASAQARIALKQVFSQCQTMDRLGLAVVLSSIAVILASLFFDMLHFEIVTNRAVTPTMAGEIRRMESLLNGHAYSVFASTFWGKLIVLGSLAAGGLVVWSFLTQSRQPWIPIAVVGAAALATVCFLLTGVIGTPDERVFAGHASYLRPDMDLTLLGYWLPLTASSVATLAGAKRLFQG